MLPEALKKKDGASRCRRAGYLALEAWEGLRLLGRLGGTAWGLALSLGAVRCLSQRELDEGRLVEFKALALRKTALLLCQHIEPALHANLFSGICWVQPSPPGPRVLAIYSRSLGARSAGHTLVSFCTNRSAE